MSQTSIVYGMRTEKSVSTSKSKSISIEKKMTGRRYSDINIMML